MGSFIHRKKEKIKNVFAKLGTISNEESFIELFKTMYPEDWEMINQKWLDEEQKTPEGKKHPMQHPNTYMKEMYRNHKGQNGYSDH